MRAKATVNVEIMFSFCPEDAMFTGASWKCVLDVLKDVVGYEIVRREEVLDGVSNFSKDFAVSGGWRVRGGGVVGTGSDQSI
jgi:hypothetical protein